MKWFKHDTTAHTDAKLKKLKHKYGITGYGLYWYCLELIAGKVEAKNISFELEEDAELIALEWSLDQLKVQEIMGYMVSLGLFESDVNGIVTCLKLAARLDDTTSRNPEIRKLTAQIAGTKVANSPDKLRDISNNSEDSSDRLDKTRLDKKRKDKKKTIVAVLPSEISEKKWLDYLESRKAKKHPMTEASLSLTIKAIQSTILDGYKPDDILNEMIAAGWRTVKPEFMEGKARRQIEPTAKKKSEDSQNVPANFNQEAYEARSNENLQRLTKMAQGIGK